MLESGARSEPVALLVWVVLALTLSACARREVDAPAKVEATPQTTREPSTAEHVDVFAELVAFQPTLSAAELPVGFSSPPRAPTMPELHGAVDTIEAEGVLPVYLERFIEVPEMAHLPDHLGACVVRSEDADGVLMSVNRTNWRDGLPLESFVDADGDSLIDEFVYYTHDVQRRLTRVVTDHPEFAESCIWRTDIIEFGYDERGALVMIDVASARHITVTPQRQARQYDGDGRVLSVFDFGADGQVAKASSVRWSGERAERVDTFTGAGDWKESLLVTERGPFTRVDWFDALRPWRGEVPHWRSAEIYEQRETALARRAILVGSPDDVTFRSENRLEEGSEVTLNYDWETGRLFSRIVTNPDGSGFAEESDSDGALVRILTKAWGASRETLVYTYQGGGRTVYEFDCEKYAPPKVVGRAKCPAVPRPVHGPHDGDI